MKSRYVILHHTDGDGEHWDLMLEHAGVLLTWKTQQNPVNTASLPLPAQRIGDHRKHYLAYEGPIAGDRGHVVRADAGTVVIHEFGPNIVAFTLDEGHLAGRFTLSTQCDGWTLAKQYESGM